MSSFLKASFVYLNVTATQKKTTDHRQTCVQWRHITRAPQTGEVSTIKSPPSHRACLRNRPFANLRQCHSRLFKTKPGLVDARTQQNTKSEPKS